MWSETKTDRRCFCTVVANVWFVRIPVVGGTFLQFSRRMSASGKLQARFRIRGKCPFPAQFTNLVHRRESLDGSRSVVLRDVLPDREPGRVSERHPTHQPSLISPGATSAPCVP